MRRLAIAVAAAVLVVTSVVQSQSKTDPVLNNMAAEWAAESAGYTIADAWL